MIKARVIWQILITTGVALLVSGCDGQDAQENTEPPEQRDVSLTLYSDGGALVRDQRELRLVAGEKRLLLDGLPHAMHEDTFFVQSERAEILSYRRGGLPSDRQSLWQRHIGKPVTLVHEPAAGGSRKGDREGRLLAVTGGYPLVQSEGEILWLGDGSPWRLRLPAADQGPGPGAVELHLNIPRDGEELLELRYRTDGMGWQADYIALLNENASLMELTAYAGLLNRGAQDWNNAQVKLLAGAPQAAPDQGPGPLRAMQTEAGPVREAVGDFHIYSLPQRVDLAAGERLRVPLKAAREVPVNKSYLTEFRAGRQVSDVTETPVEIRLAFSNISPGLGEPLPAGVVRFYTLDDEGEAQWLGEGRMDNTPAGERVELSPGRAFDITAKRRQTDYRRTGEHETEVAWQVELSNARDEAVTVRVSEDFEKPTLILSQSHEHDRISSSRIAWPVTVPAESTARLEYRVRLRR